MQADVRIAVDSRDIVGESAVWDSERRRLFWVDIIGRRICSLDPAADDVERWQTPDFVTSIGLRRGGGAIVGLMKRVALWDWGHAFETLAEIEPDHPGNRLNEGVVGPDGAFWVGTMAQNFDANGAAIPQSGCTGVLYRIAADGTVTELSPDRFGITNTLVWSSSDRLVTADSVANILYEYRIEDGRLAGRRVFLADHPRGVPDGSCLDSEGHVWNCRVAGGGCVIRIAPDGRIDRTIDLPCASPTSCAFGGEDLATLFVTSARFGMDDDHLSGNSQEGAVLALKPGARGVPANRFGDSSSR